MTQTAPQELDCSMSAFSGHDQIRARKAPSDLERRPDVVVGVLTNPLASARLMWIRMLPHIAAEIADRELQAPRTGTAGCISKLGAVLKAAIHARYRTVMMR